MMVQKYLFQGLNGISEVGESIYSIPQALKEKLDLFLSRTAILSS